MVPAVYWTGTGTETLGAVKPCDTAIQRGLAQSTSLVLSQFAIEEA